MVSKIYFYETMEMIRRLDIGRFEMLYLISDLYRQIATREIECWEE